MSRIPAGRPTVARQARIYSELAAGAISDDALYLDESHIPPLALTAAIAADDKLGQDTVVLSMRALFGMVDAFVVTSGRNVRQVRTLVEEVERKIKEQSGVAPTRVEGLHEATWVLMDYDDFIVHVFDEQTRSYYDLEHLWSSAPRVPWKQDATATATPN